MLNYPPPPPPPPPPPFPQLYTRAPSLKNTAQWVIWLMTLLRTDYDYNKTKCNFCWIFSISVTYQLYIIIIICWEQLFHCFWLCFYIYRNVSQYDILYFHLSYFHASNSVIFFTKYSGSFLLHRRRIDTFYFKANVSLAIIVPVVVDGIRYFV